MLDSSFQKTITLKNNQQAVLRYPKLSDISAIQKTYNDLVAEDTFTLFSQPLSDTQTMDYVVTIIKLMRQDQSLYLSAFSPDNSIYYGSANISRQGFRERHVGKLGISLHASIRSQGLGKQLLEELLHQAKHLMRLKLIILDYFGTNPIAPSLYQNLGFQEFGHLDNAIYFHEEYIPKVFMCKHLD